MHSINFASSTVGVRAKPFALGCLCERYDTDKDRRRESVRERERQTEIETNTEMKTNRLQNTAEIRYN